jgi:hypothetical protein
MGMGIVLQHSDSLCECAEMLRLGSSMKGSESSTIAVCIDGA